jgi:threonine aldolase
MCSLKKHKYQAEKRNRVETNIVIFDVAPGEMTAPQMARRMKDQGVLIQAFGKTQIRLVTHPGVSEEDIEQALEIFRKIFR